MKLNIIIYCFCFIFCLTNCNNSKNKNTVNNKIISINNSINIETEYLDINKIIFDFKVNKKDFCPFVILNLDTSIIDSIIYYEFKNGFIKRTGNKKYFKIPTYTMFLASNSKNNFAGNKLIKYYINIPKKLDSDTIYEIYDDLSSFLSVIVRYKSPFLINKLKKDYLEWNSISHKYYKNNSSYYYKSLFISFQIATYLYYLREKDFEKDFIENLYRKLSKEDKKSYHFNIPENINYDTLFINNDSSNFKNEIINYFNTKKYLIEKIIYNDNSALVDVYDLNWHGTYIILFSKRHILFRIVDDYLINPKLPNIESEK